MGVKRLSNPHAFVQEAHEAGVYYEELFEACECVGTQKVSRMFQGKSVRGGIGHISGVTVGNWMVTFQYATEHPDDEDSDPFQARSITPTKEWRDYIDVVRIPISASEVKQWKGLGNKALGDAAEAIGITKGVRNAKSLKTLLDRMTEAVRRRRQQIWSKVHDTENQTPLEDRLDYRLMNVHRLKDKCVERGIVSTKLKKDEMIVLLREYDARPLETALEEQHKSYKDMTCNQLKSVCKDRGFIMYNNLNKDSLIELIEKDDEKKSIHVDTETGEEVSTDMNAVVPWVKTCKIGLDKGNMYEISVREDGYVNATELCKAGAKEFYDWHRTDQGRALIKALESDTNIPGSQLIETYKGNTTRFKQGTWIHRDLVIPLAQWVSPVFAIQVSRTMQELFSTGSVTLERRVRPITDMSQRDIEAEILESELDWSQNRSCMTLYAAYVGNGMIKVGSTDSGLDERTVKHTSTESGYSQFRMIGLYRISSRKIEVMIHRLLDRFKVEFRRQKEVFKPEGTLRDFIAGIGKLVKDNDHRLGREIAERRVLELEAEVARLKLQIIS